jgi:hypothetical protein
MAKWLFESFERQQSRLRIEKTLTERRQACAATEGPMVRAREVFSIK